ncbi:PREDICTED: fas apoptotic inhibitory molecule 3 isoform X2 [Dipodomys ordii]|nr:PREDICTED: fas apoptotic inhibitory molecule 3 isoform X2 [Dipodomys ordii]
MDFWLWSLYFLPVSGALRILPEVQLDGELGGSIIIKCPMPDINVRLYLCRQMTKSGACVTVVSSTFIRKEYWDRITLKPCSDKNLFLVAIMKLTESDSGIYACGVGKYTDLGKTQKVILNVHNAYEPFLEEEPISGPPEWFHRYLHMQMPKWLQIVTQTSSSESIAAVTTPAQRMESSPAHHSSPTTLAIHYPGVSRTSSVATAKPPTLLTTTTSKTPTQEGLFGHQVTSYNYHTRQRSFYHSDGSSSGSLDQGFHILVPTILGLLLLALLWLVIKRAVQRRKGELDTALSGPGASAPPQGPPQVSEAPRLLAQPWKASYEYVSLCHKPAVEMVDTDSDDYVNIANLTHLPGCSLGPIP